MYVHQNHLDSITFSHINFKRGWSDGVRFLCDTTGRYGNARLTHNDGPRKQTPTQFLQISCFATFLVRSQFRLFCWLRLSDPHLGCTMFSIWSRLATPGAKKPLIYTIFYFFNVSFPISLSFALLATDVARQHRVWIRNVINLNLSSHAVGPIRKSTNNILQYLRRARPFIRRTT